MSHVVCADVVASVTELKANPMGTMKVVEEDLLLY